MQRKAAWCVVTLVVVCLGAALLAGACGAPDVTGTYKSTGAGQLPEGTTLTLNDDGTFTAEGTVPIINTKIDLSGTWTQDGSTVTINPQGTFAKYITDKVGTYEDGTLTFGKEVFQKQ